MVDRSAVAADGRRPVEKILTTRGVLEVRLCPLCTALVVDEQRHGEQHAADARRADDVADRAVALLDEVLDVIRPERLQPSEPGKSFRSSG